MLHLQDPAFRLFVQRTFCHAKKQNRPGYQLNKIMYVTYKMIGMKLLGLHFIILFLDHSLPLLIQSKLSHSQKQINALVIN